MNEPYTKYLRYFLFLVLAAFPVFAHLDSLAIRVYDEGRLAINALEMLENRNFLVTHFFGSPDMWNTKPPLLIWLQVGLMQLIGVNELAIRLPSAFAALFTGLALMIFLQKYLEKTWMGFVAAMVLITSPVYLTNHVSRTGDYDALLIFFTTISCLAFFAYCEKPKNKYLYIFFSSTALAVLTKSISGLLFLPALGIYCLYRKQVLPTLRNKHFYLGLITFILMVGSYYVLREHYNSGYLTAIWENELGGRYLNTLENHQHGFWFYWVYFLKNQLPIWYLLIPCGLVVGYYHKDQKVWRLTFFLSLLILTFFMIISSAQTKLEWYSAPLYPFLAILVALFVNIIFEWLQSAEWSKQYLRKNILPYLFLLLLLALPYQSIVQKSLFPQDLPGEQVELEITYYLRDAIKGNYDFQGQYLLVDAYQPQNYFYLKALNDQGSEISIQHWNKLKAGDRGITYQDHVKSFVESNYLFQKIYSKGNIITYEIQGRKP